MWQRRYTQTQRVHEHVGVRQGARTGVGLPVGEFEAVIATAANVGDAVVCTIVTT